MTCLDSQLVLGVPLPALGGWSYRETATATQYLHGFSLGTQTLVFRLMKQVF